MSTADSPVILIVDDEEDLCQYLKLMISKRSNYTVELAHDGTQAMETIRGRAVNVVVSDINMPKMDGIELLGHIKNFDPEIEVILLTGRGTMDTTIKALQQQAFDYIEKPVESHRLLLSIGNALGRQKLNLELKRVLEKVQRMNAELKEKVSRQSAELARRERLAITGGIAATLGSEMLGPLETIQALSSKLASGPASAEEQARSGAQIKELCSRLILFMRDIVSFSDQHRPRLETLDTQSFLCDVVEQTTGRFPDVEVQLDEGDRLIKLSVDPRQLQQAVSHLVENACEAMDGKGRIEIHSKLEGERWHLSISDSGPGIPEDQIERIFLPFFTSKGEDSTGLGLTVVKRIIEDHRGDIRVSSTSGRGTTMTIALPIAGA